MKRMDWTRPAAAVMLLAACVFAGAGCDEHVAGQLVTLSSSYLGDMVSVVVTHCLQNALDVEAVDSQTGDEHEHDAGALHDHEH